MRRVIVIVLSGLFVAIPIAGSCVIALRLSGNSHLGSTLIPPAGFVVCSLVVVATVVIATRLWITGIRDKMAAMRPDELVFAAMRPNAFDQPLRGIGVENLPKYLCVAVSATAGIKLVGGSTSELSFRWEEVGSVEEAPIRGRQREWSGLWITLRRGDAVASLPLIIIGSDQSRVKAQSAFAVRALVDKVLSRRQERDRA